MGSRLKRALRSSIPLPLRMRLAIWLNRQPWFTRDYLAVGLVGDLGLQDPEALQVPLEAPFHGLCAMVRLRG